MKIRPVLTTALLLFAALSAYTQINYTANDFGHIPAYTKPFLYGTNMGYYGPSWDDKSLADISIGDPSRNINGAGVRSLRVSLPEHFVEMWGYDIRLSEFNHYGTLGIQDNVVMLGEPSAAHRDAKYPGCPDESGLFKNMYAPIWDGGLNGTPVNDTNYFALYVYKVVTKYKANVKFWEIINEPDIDYGGRGWMTPGMPGNWWENNPLPCELANVKAPIFHYIRTLRIAYEVIKSIDPEALVAPGGIGYASFVDALLRNTDNPVDGSVTAEYPLKAGAYFDVLSYHIYPSYSLKSWNNNTQMMDYRRHSDAAADEYVKLKNDMTLVLSNYGYNGTTYPLKYVICTETNISRVPFMNGTDPLIGSDDAQKNYIMKVLLQSQMHGVSQLYTFLLGDTRTEATATNEYDVMGLYKNLISIGPLWNGGAYNTQLTNSGIGFKTTSELLRNKTFDPVKTAWMNIPSGIEGGAFHDAYGNYVYVLWARTVNDQSESATESYSFPLSMNMNPLVTKREWNYSVTGINTDISSSDIMLNATPIFIYENLLIADVDPDSIARKKDKSQFEVNVFPVPANTNATVSFTLRSPEKVTIELYDGNGRKLNSIMQSKNYSTGKHSLPVDVSSIAPGMYYFRISTEKISTLKKVIIVR